MEKVKSVDGYIANAVEEARHIMVELRAIIKSTIPESEEVISWNVPIYKYHGILVGFSVAKKHVSLGIDTLTMEDRELLAEGGYKTGKKTIQIKFDQEVPEDLIVKIIKDQAQINQGLVK
ncbi:iron chaperone [Membranihabitans marinus]|uniref:iron chaperone n=1 Tax=Membranihabitans marinus TaxID=1227546 RepID=UPI001F3D3851|nr:DUF1801 domain-containing protein [Membranihabitans marinus]